MLQFNEIQEGVAKKIKLGHTTQQKKKKFAPICTGYAKELTKQKFTGLMHFLVSEGMEGETEILLEDPRKEESKSKWNADNYATVSRLKRPPLSLTEWRTSKPEWLHAKKSVDIFFNGSGEQYRELFSDKEWNLRKKVYANLKNMQEAEVTDGLLIAQFIESQKEAVIRIKTQVDNWKKNPRNKEIPDEEVKEHFKEIVADILFMTGRGVEGEDKWQMLYEHTLQDQINHVESCAWLLGYDGKNFEHVMIAFNKGTKHLEDEAFGKKEDPDADASQCIGDTIPVKTAPISIPKRSSPQQSSSQKKSTQHSPKHHSPPIDEMTERALEMVLNSQVGMEAARIASEDPIGADKTLKVMTASVVDILSQAAAPSVEARKSLTSTSRAPQPSSQAIGELQGRVGTSTSTFFSRPAQVETVVEFTSSSAGMVVDSSSASSTEKKKRLNSDEENLAHGSPSQLKKPPKLGRSGEFFEPVAPLASLVGLPPLVAAVGGGKPKQ